MSQTQERASASIRSRILLRDRIGILAVANNPSMRRELNGLVARRALAWVPEVLLLRPEAACEGIRNGRVQCVSPVPAPQLDDVLLTRIHRAVTDGDDAAPGFSLVPVDPDTGLPSRWNAVGWSWQEMADAVSEATLETLHAAFRGRAARYQYAAADLLHRTWKLISGANETTVPCPGERFDSHDIFFRKRRRALAENREMPVCLPNDTDPAQPVLLAGCRNRFMLGLLLRQGVDPLDHAGGGGRITPEDIEREFGLINPLYRTAEQTCDGILPQLSSPTTGKSVTAEDRSFLEMLSRRFILFGQGAYRHFSIQHWGYHDGRACVAVCLSLGRKPFLQQAVAEPMFIYWDLKNHPITVFFYFVIEEGKLVDLLNSIVMTECNHPSICRHAFVRRAQEQAPPHYGTVCTENTRFRLLGLLEKASELDPAAFLVAQLRATARILRYGLRQRDLGITQHNQFGKVPASEFQAVIQGYDQASEFAARNGAEIVYFDR